MPGFHHTPRAQKKIVHSYLDFGIEYTSRNVHSFLETLIVPI